MGECFYDVVDDPDNRYPLGWVAFFNLVFGNGCDTVAVRDSGFGIYNDPNLWKRVASGPAGTKPGKKPVTPPPPPPDPCPGPDCPPDPGPDCSNVWKCSEIGLPLFAEMDSVPPGYSDGFPPSGNGLQYDDVIMVKGKGNAYAYCDQIVSRGGYGNFTDDLWYMFGFNHLDTPVLPHIEGRCVPKGYSLYYKPKSHTPAPPDECCPPDTNPALMAIKDAIDELTDKIGGEAMDCAKIADKCIDEITDAVIKKLKTTTKTCKQCCQEISEGVSHSAAEALICAACECEDCHKSCSLGDPDNEGSCCDTCGQEKCICQGEECIPVEGEPPQEHTYFAWCNAITGQFAVTKDQEQPPVGGLNPIGSASTRAEAEALAANCGIVITPSPEPTINPRPPVMDSSPWQCNLGWWGSGAAAADLAAWSQDAVAWTYVADVWAQTTQAIADEFGRIPVIGPAITTAAAPFTSSIAVTTALAPIVAKLAGCGNSSVVQGMQQMAMFGTLSKYAGIDFSDFATPVIYAMNTECRLKVLDPDKAIASWLASSMDDKELDTTWAMHGLCQDALERYKYAARSKPLPLQLAVMLRRGMITEEEYNIRMRELGYMEPKTRRELLDLTEQRPPYSDIVRMMVRDADDDGIATKFGTDTDFTKKFSTQLRQWAVDQGVPESVMKYLWRAHWSIPSPGQLYEMYHRLRNDPEYGGPDKFLTDVKDALEQQDILPFWIERLLKVSFRPIGRIDVRRAYNIGSMDDDDVVKAYNNLGYSDEDSQTMLRFSRKLRNQAANSSKYIKQWQKWAIDGATARAKMIDDGIPADVVDVAIKETSIGFDSSWPVKAFVAGEVSAVDLTETLRNFGVDSDAIAAIIKKRAGAVSYHPAAMLYAAGTMSFDDAYNQMTQYGMLPGRAGKILQKTKIALDTRSMATCVDAIQSRYTLGELTAGQAEGELSARGIVPERVSMIMAQWNCELTAISKNVPASTLCSWLASGVIQPQDFVDRLDRMGYTKNDAIRLLVDCQGNINAKQAKEAIAKAKSDAAALQKQQNRAAKQAKQLEQEAAKIQRAQSAAKAARTRRSRQSSNAAEKLYKASGLPLADVTDKVNDTYSRLQREFALNADEALQALLQASESFASDSLNDYDSLANTYAQMIVNRALTPDEIPPG